MSAVSLSIEDLNGEISIGERGEANEHGGYSTLALCSAEPNDINFDISFDEYGLQLSLSCYHVEGVDGRRFFHSRIRINLTSEQISNIHKFTGYLCDAGY